MPRAHRGRGQPALPRRDDVRRLGQPATTTTRSGSSTRRSTPGSTSSTPPTSTRRASRRRSSARRSPGGATRSCSRPSSTGRWARARTAAATRGAGSSRRSRTSLRRLGTDWIDLYQVHRPEPDDRHRRDARRADRPRPRGQDPLLRQLDLPGARDRRGAVGRRAARPRALRLRAAALLDARPRASSATCCPVCERYGMGVIPWSPLAGGWLSGGYRKGEDLPASTRAERLPWRYDLSHPREPGASSRRPRRSPLLAEEAGHRR